jgi:hypothetical protein
MLDLEGLQLVLDSAESEPCMGSWHNCLIGQFCSANPEDALQLQTRPFSKFPEVFFGDFQGHAAVAARFGLSDAQEEHLFGPYVPDTLAVARLRDFIDTHKSSSRPRRTAERQLAVAFGIVLAAFLTLSQPAEACLFKHHGHTAAQKSDDRPRLLRPGTWKRGPLKSVGRFVFGHHR